MTSIRLCSPPARASPISGGWCSATSATSLSRSGRPPPPSIAMFPSWSAPVVGGTSWVPLRTVGDVAQPQRRPVDALDRDVAELVGAGDRRDVLDADPLVRGLDEAAGAGRGGLHEAQRGDPQRVAGRLDQLGQGDVVALQPLG